MGDDGLDCDIETIIHDRNNEEFDVLHRLSVPCQEYNAGVDAFVESYLASQNEYVQKCETFKEQIAHLHSEYKEKVTACENAILEQKVTAKKKAIMEKQQAKLMEEIEAAKIRKESIALEVVDIMQEIRDRKTERKERWNAIKKACLVFKEKLDFHLDFVECGDYERVQVTFFIHKNPNKDSYYVYLLNYRSYWKVGQIEPPLKEVHLEDLKGTKDFTKSLDILGVIIFLCKLRRTFLKHYFKK